MNNAPAAVLEMERKKLSLIHILMNRLPDKEKLTAVQTEPTMWQTVKPWLYMTAMLIGAALIVRVASSEHTRSVERMAADDTETEMEYINMAVENSMLDD